jgi:hypothetical protein
VIFVIGTFWTKCSLIFTYKLFLLGLVRTGSAPFDRMIFEEATEKPVPKGVPNGVRPVSFFRVPVRPVPKGINGVRPDSFFRLPVKPVPKGVPSAVRPASFFSLPVKLPKFQVPFDRLASSEFQNALFHPPFQCRSTGSIKATQRASFHYPFQDPIRTRRLE